MSDYRQPNDPWHEDSRYEMDARNYNAVWGWIAGAIFLVAIAVIGVGIAHKPILIGAEQLAKNISSSAADQTASPPSQVPPANGPASRSFTPSPKNTTQP